jgi:hypothetical protein
LSDPSSSLSLGILLGLAAADAGGGEVDTGGREIDTGGGEAEAGGGEPDGALWRPSPIGAGATGAAYTGDGAARARDAGGGAWLEAGETEQGTPATGQGRLAAGAGEDGGGGRGGWRGGWSRGRRRQDGRSWGRRRRDGRAGDAGGGAARAAVPSERECIWEEKKKNKLTNKWVP